MKFAAGLPRRSCSPCSPPRPAASAKSVHIRGTAYEFNNTGVLLAGAKIRVAERPRLQATVRRDGTYDLVVPDHAKVTPYIVAAGHHTIYLQTFRTDGEDLERVNFQTPDGRRLPRAGGAAQRAPRAERRAARLRHRVHLQHAQRPRPPLPEVHRVRGARVSGATAFATPALPAAIYFNESVIPDPAQPRSSIDGGVLWTRVPAGVYRIRARHPSTRFASFVATCRPGRVVNANPPWGLHELGRPMRASVSAGWSVSGSDVWLRSLRATRLPAGVIRADPLHRPGLSVPAADRRAAGGREREPARRARRRGADRCTPASASRCSSARTLTTPSSCAGGCGRRGRPGASRDASRSGTRVRARAASPFAGPSRGPFTDHLQ